MTFTTLLPKSMARAALAGALFTGQLALGQSPVAVVVDPTPPSPNISSNFIGLSYETALVLPGRNGKHFFSPENRTLLRMFQSLGVGSLRVGGNTAERESVAIPGKADIDSLFGFAKAAGVRVIYTLRLKGADAQADAEIAKYMLDNYASSLTCFALGNEPEKMAKDFPSYQQEFRRFMEVITAPANAPGARFCGPSTTHLHAGWADQFARTFGHDRRIALVTQHEYPGRSGIKLGSKALGLERLLSPDLLKTYEAFHDEFVPTVFSTGLPYRLEEANSFSNGGAAGVSDAFAAALWGLDYLYWWADHGAQGINFHTGGYPAGDRPRSPMKYAVFWNSGEGFRAQPLAYALKAFDLGANGRLVPARLTANAGGINLRAYAVLTREKSIYVTLINKEHGPGCRDADVSLSSSGGYICGRVMFLAASGGDVEAKTGVTLGGGSIGDDGYWDGAWTALKAAPDSHRFQLKVPAASAAIVKLAAN